MGKAKIVILGAGSVSFGPSILGDLFSYADRLRDSDIWLVDLNPESLDVTSRVAKRMNEAFGAPFVLHASTDRNEALPDADFVIVSVAVDRLAAWQLDWQIPLKHGVRHVLGENGGPGGMSHALRNIPLLLGIARDVEKYAPNALLLNFTNPMTRLCMALGQPLRHAPVSASKCAQSSQQNRSASRRDSSSKVVVRGSFTDRSCPACLGSGHRKLAPHAHGVRSSSAVHREPTPITSRKSS